MSWKITDESSITFQLSVSGASEFGLSVNQIYIFFNFYSIKPTLKKVSKYENKFAKLQKKAAEFNFRNQLKTVKKKEFTLEEDDKEQEVCPLFTT